MNKNQNQSYPTVFNPTSGQWYSSTPLSPHVSRLKLQISTSRVQTSCGNRQKDIVTHWVVWKSYCKEMNWESLSKVENSYSWNCCGWSGGRCEIPNCQLGQSLLGGEEGAGRGLPVYQRMKMTRRRKRFPLLSLSPSRICPCLTVYLSVVNFVFVSVGEPIFRC